jgi:hypothetical protein
VLRGISTHLMADLKALNNCVSFASNSETLYQKCMRCSKHLLVTDFWVDVSIQMLGNFGWRLWYTEVVRPCVVWMKTWRKFRQRTLTISEISGRLGLSYGTRQQILMEDLNMQLISAMSVPMLLINKQKQWFVFVCRKCWMTSGTKKTSSRGRGFTVMTQKPNSSGSFHGMYCKNLVPCKHIMQGTWAYQFSLNDPMKDVLYSSNDFLNKSITQKNKLAIHYMFSNKNWNTVLTAC